ncbi:hypothetical protein GMORB2_3428 [Geosmithia morbida]|uniref:Uncharacterized protein n=1 Tax=Geosmithia morbida TaxID=1094350 RepID=A0A9P5CZ29_9HYPO|nr:uncharacterized protein GMORB2_3428 [Geosmithia morbida]KAF4120017.1 hypothetical protein GMORB2_3428 [Geosmithia morbida]
MTNSRSQALEATRPTDVPAITTSKPDQGKKKRSLFGLVRKKTDDKSAAEMPTISAADTQPAVRREPSQVSSTTRSATSPNRTDSFPIPPASPNRALSTSPRISSPARSQIFERDVQDNNPATQPASPAIPTHIQTEDHIPPVLGDASEAITNSKLDPDAIEIVTQRFHQPASVTVNGTGTAPSTVGSQYDDQQSAAEWAKELSSFAANRESAAALDSASNYGSLDSADVRRLSFISFADVVQSEQGSSGMAPLGSASRESMHLAGLTSLPPSGLNRSPSPIRSPVSSQGPGTSPPTSNPGSIKGLDLSPPRKPAGSSASVSQSLGVSTLTQSGELSIETMSQALRRTGSRDLSNVRSIPTSPLDGPGSR